MNDVISNSKHINIYKWIAVFLLLLIFYYTIEVPLFLQELDILRRYQSGIAKPLLYLINFLFCIAALVILLFQKNKWLFFASLALVQLSFIINLGYKDLNTIGIGYNDFLLLQQNVGFGLGQEALITFLPSILKATITSIIFIVTIVFLRKYIPLIEKRFLWLVLIPFFTSYLILNKSSANRVAFPSFYKLPSLIVYTYNNTLYINDRLPVFFAPEYESDFDHIVWIVDESVRGDLLQLNNPSMLTTPFLDSIKERHISNFGVASSGAVCSDYSHIMLMSGITSDQLPDKKQRSRINPSIFQYAQSAGYSSNLIYSPGYEDAPKGYMTPNDFDYIENRFHTKMLHPEIPAYQWDHQSIDYLEEIIHTKSKTFTYFLKYGAHFHYDHSYPEDRTFFTPIQGANSYKREERGPLLNSYKNALRWTVDDFFNQVHHRFKDEKILFIYTSDHGQNILDHPEITMTHCIKDRAPQVMAAVPLFIYCPQENVVPDFGFVNASDQTASHFNIFPTTLALMGYDKMTIHQLYSYTLLDEGRNDSIYISGDIFDRSTMYKNVFDYRLYFTKD